MAAEGGTSNAVIGGGGDDAAAQPCPHCGQADFNYEDLDEGTKLVCRECGFVLDEVLLVHQRTMDEDGRVQQQGAYVGVTDDGRRAGATLQAPGTTPHGLRGARNLVLANNREQLDNALAFLGLPQHVVRAARLLLPQVVTAYGAATPRMLVTPPVVAAVVYAAARGERHALSFGGAAAALGAPGPHVYQEYKRIKQVLELEVAPPSLESAVVHAAALLLPHYLPAMSGPLRSQPLLQKALAVTRLVSDTGAGEGRSPWVAAAAILSMCLAEHYGDAGPSMYGREVAARLNHSPAAVLDHIRVYEQQLTPLLALLPFTVDQDSRVVGTQIVRSAGILLKLQALSRKSAPAPGAPK